VAKVKVILRTDVAGLGEEGEVKDVAGGYARNYLLPGGMAMPATKGNLKVLEQQRSQIEVNQEQHRVEARALADRRGLDAVGEVDHLGLGAGAKDHTLTDPDERIGRSEVGQERDERRRAEGRHRKDEGENDRS